MRCLRNCRRDKASGGMVLGWHELLLWRGMKGSLFQREGAALRKDLSENLSPEVSLGCARQRQFEERMGRVG